MKIRTKHIREGGSVHEIGGIHYHFKPEKEGGPHVADVTDEDHIARFLSLKDGFVEDRVAQRNEERTKPQAKSAPKAEVIRDRSKADQHPTLGITNETDPRDADTKEALQTQYRELSGRPAHHTWDIPKLRAKIEEAKAANEGTGTGSTGSTDDAEDDEGEDA